MTTRLTDRTGRRLRDAWRVTERVGWQLADLHDAARERARDLRDLAAEIEDEPTLRDSADDLRELSEQIDRAADAVEVVSDAVEAESVGFYRVTPSHELRNLDA